MTDYAVLVESPSSNVSMIVLDGQGKLKGFAKKKVDQYLPLFMDSSYPEQYTIMILNFSNAPVNFGLKTFQIIW